VPFREAVCVCVYVWVGWVSWWGGGGGGGEKGDYLNSSPSVCIYMYGLNSSNYASISFALLPSSLCCVCA
jgi:hypothetical protein